jgi:hypothetical protein
MTESAFQDLKVTDVEDVYPIYEEIEEEMDNFQLTAFVGENMPSFVLLAHSLSQSAIAETGERVAGNGVALGFLVAAAVVWKRLETLSLNPATEAGARAAKAQEVLQDTDDERLANIVWQFWTELGKDAENFDESDANHSPTLQGVAAEYEGLFLLLEHVCDDRVARGAELDSLKFIRAGGIAFIAIMRELEIATELDALLRGETGV